MKRYLILLTLCALGIGWYVTRTISHGVTESHLLPPSPPPSTPSVTRQQHGTILEYHNIVYRGVYYIVSQERRISLLPNFTEALSAQDVYDTHRCVALANGNFYTPDKKPIGLFEVSGKRITNEIASATFNGFFWGYNGTYDIGYSPGSEPYGWIVQSGPILIANGQVLPLTIRNDESARRVVAGITKTGDVVFMGFTSDENAYEGPTLAALPAIVNELNQRHDLGMRWAINLDGGSASAFISPDISLTEFTEVGSFFCVQ